MDNISLKTLELVNQNRLEEALICQEEFIQENNFKADPHNQKGLILLKLQRFKEALAAFHFAIQLNPQIADFYHNKGKALFGLNRFEGALDQFKTALTIQPHGISFNLSIASVYFQLNNLDQALTACLEEIRIHPDNAEAHSFKISIFLKKKQFSSAIFTIDEAIKNMPSKEIEFKQQKKEILLLIKLEEDFQRNLQAIIRKGEEFMKLGQYSNAMQQFKEVYAKSPTVTTQVLIIKAQIKLQNYEEVYKLCIETLKEHPNNSNVITEYSTALFNQNRLSESLQVIEKAIEADSKNVLAYNIKSEILSKLNQFKAALEVINNALRIDSKHEQSQLNKIRILISLSRFEEALTVLTQSNFKQLIDSHEAFKLKCRALLESNRTQEALNFCNTTALFDPEHFIAFAIKGEILCRQKNFFDAIEAFECSIRINPIQSEVYVNKSLALIQLKRYQDAIIVCDQVILIDKSCVEAYKIKGEAYCQLGQYLNSKAVFLKALEIHPRELVFYIRLALVSMKQQKFVEAFDSLKQALLIDRNYLAAVFTKAHIYRILNQELEAKLELKTAIQLFKEDNEKGLVSKNLAQITVLLGLYDDLEQLVNSLSTQEINSSIWSDEQSIEFNEQLLAFQMTFKKIMLFHVIDFCAEIVNKLNYFVLENNNLEEELNTLKQTILGFQSNSDRMKCESKSLVYPEFIRYRQNLLEQFKKFLSYPTNFSTIPSEEIKKIPQNNDIEIVREKLIKIELGEREVLNYCKTFFWTSLSLVTAYRTVAQKKDISYSVDVKTALKQNEFILSEEIASVASTLQDKDIKHEEIDILRANPLSCDALIALHSIINSILLRGCSDQQNSSRINSEMLRVHQQVIQRKLSSNEILSTQLAFAAIDLAAIKGKEDSIEVQKEESVEAEIEKVKDQVVESMKIEGQSSQLAVIRAIRDAVHLMVLFAVYGEQISEIKMTVHEQIVKLIKERKVDSINFVLHESEQTKNPTDSNFKTRLEEEEEAEKRNNISEIIISVKVTQNEVEIPNQKHDSSDKKKKGCQCSTF